MGNLMHFNCMPRLTGVASSHPGPCPHCCPHPLPHAQTCPITVPILGSGITSTATTSASRGRRWPRAGRGAVGSSSHPSGAGGLGEGEAPGAAAACGWAGAGGLGRRRVPSSRSILRSFTIKNKAGRISKPNTGLARLQREVDDLLCATHALKIIINRVKNEK